MKLNPPGFVRPMPLDGANRLLRDMAIFHQRALSHFDNCAWLRRNGVHDIYHGATGPHSRLCPHEQAKAA